MTQKTNLLELKLFVNHLTSITDAEKIQVLLRRAVDPQDSKEFVNFKDLGDVYELDVNDISEIVGGYEEAQKNRRH